MEPPSTEYREQYDVSEEAGQVAELLRVCKRNCTCFVVYVGAGASESAGVPTFHGKGAGTLLTVREDLADTHAPNYTQRSVAALVQSGLVSSVVTSNHDNLLRKAGIPDERLIEMFGNAYQEKCLACHHLFQRRSVPPALSRTCSLCGGKLKKTGVRYGQTIPKRPFERGWEVAKRAEACLVLGSGMHTYPLSADGMPGAAKCCIVVTLGAKTRSLCPAGATFVNARCDPFMRSVMVQLEDVPLSMYVFVQQVRVRYAWQEGGEMVTVVVENSTVDEGVTCALECTICIGALTRYVDRNELSWSFKDGDIRARVGDTLTVSVSPREEYAGALPLLFEIFLGEEDGQCEKEFRHSKFPE